ncbi:MAG: ABC transporter permease subunit [candidate division Zixibacteria bacterium]|nr:ABC transporter permease subunit [candidate division Zixibacteria bacterium]
MRRIVHIARKEILQTFRDRRMVGILFVAPLFQLLVFGYAATYDIDLIPTAVIDYDNSSLSRELIHKISASEYFEIQAYPENTDSLTELIDRGDIWCGIVIPPDYDKRIKTSQAVDLQAIIDGSNSNTAGIVGSYLAKIIQDYSFELMAQNKSRQLLTASGNGIQLPLEARVRAWYNPTLSSQIYNVPAVLVMIMLVITMILTSMAVVKEKEIGTIEQISVTPIKPLELMVGKTLPFVMIGVVDIILATAVSIFWFKIPFLGSIWVLLLASFTFMLTTLGTGLLISTFSGTQQQAMMTTFLFIMPFMILSGFAFPISNMPIEIQYFTYINPVRYFVEIVRAIFLKGSGVIELKYHLLALLIIGLTVMSMSVARFRKRSG